MSTIKKKPTKKTTNTDKALTPKKVMEGIDKLRKAQEATDKFIKELGKGSDERMEATDKRIKELSKQIGGVHNSSGQLAEAFFRDAISERKTIGKNVFTALIPNLELGNKKNRKGEIDILLTNGTSVAIIEVKQKATEEHITKLLNKIKPFKETMPRYKNDKIYLALASFIIPKEVEQAAKKHGIAILKRKGKVFENTNNNLKAY